MELIKSTYNNQIRHFLKGNSASPWVDCFIDGIKDNDDPKVINSIVDKNKKALLYQWKIKIAGEINRLRKISSAPKIAALSLSFFFHQPFHGNRDLDIENFIKPVIDGVAKGLFSIDWDKEKTQEKIHFNEDDSIFRNIYLERFDVDEPKEGVYITVWEI